MNRGAIYPIAAAACAAAACSTDTNSVQIRPASTSSLASVDADSRLGEAHALLALGNAGLALELYRKHLRYDPASLEAQVGIAACYDRMGRFDLSRRHYEAALAVAPGDAAVLDRFAASLDIQGLKVEAATVRDEIRMRRADVLLADVVPDPDLVASAGPLAGVPTAIPTLVAASVTIALPAAEPAPQATPTPAPAPAFAVAETPAVAIAKPQAVAVAEAAPPALMPPVRTDAVPQRKPAILADARWTGPKTRLVRLSPAEVTLVSPGKSAWKPRVMARTAGSTTVRFVPLKSAATASPFNVRLLNAARTAGLAGRTRNYLMARGWRRIAVGDAPEARDRSVIMYPASRRRTAEILAAQFGIPIAREAGGRDIVMLLGRDSSGLKALRAKA